MKHPIPFCSWTLRSPRMVEIPDDTPEPLRLKVAVETAVREKADLRGADLAGADLTDVKTGIPIPVVPDIDAAILAAIEAGGRLEMGKWHTCETTHCRAGWAVHLAGDAGYALEDRYGPALAGALIYAASRPGKPVPNFYATDEDALADIRRCAKGEG